MKKFNISLEPSKVEQLKNLSRRRAVILGRDLNWVMLLREAVDQIIAADELIKHAPITTGVVSARGVT